MRSERQQRHGKLSILSSFLGIGGKRCQKRSKPESETGKRGRKRKKKDAVGRIEIESKAKEQLRFHFMLPFPYGFSLWSGKGGGGGKAICSVPTPFFRRKEEEQPNYKEEAAR